LRYDPGPTAAVRRPRVEPLAAAVRPPPTGRVAALFDWLVTKCGGDPRLWRQHEAVIKLIAGILGISFDQLWRRERRRQWLRRLQVAAVLLATTAAAAGVWRQMLIGESRELARPALDLLKSGGATTRR